MNAIHPQQRPPARVITLLAIVGLHWLLYGTLLQPPTGQQQPPTPAAPGRALLLWQVPALPTVAPTPAVARVVSPPVREKVSSREPPQANPARPTGVPVGQTAQIALPAANAPAAPVSTATATAPASAPGFPATKTVPDELQGYLPGNTRRELARIASELRKESHFPADFNVHAKPDKLAQGIANAYRGDGSVTITDIKLPDGRVMTKVTGALGSICIYKDSVGHTGGRDQMQSGVPTKTTTCPK